MKINKTTTLLSVIFIVMVLCISGCDRKKRYIYLIPEGYAGWLGVSYGVDGAPPLDVENGYQVIRFSDNGFVETSSLGTPGPGKEFDDQFYYYDGSHRRPVNVAVELGGGGTVQQQHNVETNRFTSQFWISRNARSDWEKYVKDKPVQYGQFKNYIPEE